jgi:hypothetical protein
MERVVMEIPTKIWGQERTLKVVEEKGKYYVEGRPVKAYDPKTKEFVVLDPLGRYMTTIIPELAQNYFNRPMRVELDEHMIRSFFITPFRGC